MFRARAAVLWVSLLLSWTLASGRAFAGSFRDGPFVDGLAPPRQWGGSEEPWTPEEPHRFLAGGFSFLATKTIQTWGVGGWNLTAGAEVPIRSSWTLVPRAHFSAASNDESGLTQWLRVALDGRLSTERAGIVNYQEAGLGMGVIGTHVTTWEDAVEPGYEQRWSGTPFLQYVAGMHGDSNQGPTFLSEIIVMLGLGHETPGGLELLVGFEF